MVKTTAASEITEPTVDIISKLDDTKELWRKRQKKQYWFHDTKKFK